MQSLIIKHVRAMAKSFAHMQHESSCKVLLRCGVLSAQAQLQKETEGLLRRLRTHAETTPLVSSSYVEALRAQAASLQAADMIGVDDTTQTIGGDPGYHCHTCGRTFHSFPLFRSHEAKWHQQKTPSPQQATFDRFAHGTDGLPTCRHCGHRFRQWANLVQHIQRNSQVLRKRQEEGDSSSRPLTKINEGPGAEAAESEGSPLETSVARQTDLCQEADRMICPPEASPPCPIATTSPKAGDSTPAEQGTAGEPAPESPETLPSTSLPLQDWPVVTQHLQAGTWTQLLECSEVQQYLQHHCPICMQWAATPNGLKCHMTNQHEEWRQQPIQHLLKSFRRHTVLPCRYCKQSRVNKDRHWQQCHVLSFCAFLRVRHDVQHSGRRGSGRSGTALLPAHGASIRSSSRPQPSGIQQPSTELGSCQEAESGGSGKKQRRQGQGQGQGKGRAPSRPIPGSGHLSLGPNVGIQQWLQRGLRNAGTVVCRQTEMVLRQEQTLSALRQDLMLYLFVRSGEQGMIPILCQAADKWRQLKEETPEKLGYSLKLAMFKQLMITLQERLTETSKNPQAMDHAKSLNWVDTEGCWRILKWNGTKQNLEIDTTVQSTSTENLLSQIVQVRKAINETSPIRFKSIRRLTEGVQTEWVTFQIFVSLRPEGSPIWSSLTSWIGQAAFHVIGCRLRRDRPQYDALAASLWE